MNIEPLKSLCTYVKEYDSGEICGYFNWFTVFRLDNILDTITIFSPETYSFSKWSYKKFTSPQDALNELIQSISKIKYIQVQSKLNSIDKDF